MAAEKQYKWTDEDTKRLITQRTQNDHLFTGKRHSAKKAWGEVIKMMGLEGILTSTQELRNPPSGTGTDGGEATAATWPWFSLMHESIGRRPSIEPPVLMDSCVGENPEPVANVAPSGSSSRARSTTCGQASAEEEESVQPGTSSGTAELDDEPSTSTRPPPRKRQATKALLNFLKEKAKKEEERFAETQQTNKCFLDLFEDLVRKS
ncbi:uncharacterized protein LOC119488532 [Sebastes umbrosus]|uniref:uncharacterized protein LOC119488532 n=1 Tax=Sebastes umbrosus TaxID=72105 RepID=UPI00189C8DD6|nr:uncharacterized protein LOC119488532 [Sebastes umbrosus]